MHLTKNATVAMLDASGGYEDDDDDVDQEVDDITRGKELTASPSRFASSSSTPTNMIRVL